MVGCWFLAAQVHVVFGGRGVCDEQPGLGSIVNPLHYIPLIINATIHPSPEWSVTASLLSFQQLVQVVKEITEHIEFFLNTLVIYDEKKKESQKFCSNCPDVLTGMLVITKTIYPNYYR